MPFVMQDKWEKNQHFETPLLEHKQQPEAPGGTGTAEIDAWETPPLIRMSQQKKYRINI